MNAVESTSTPGFDPESLSVDTKPHEDFFLYANGGWLKNNPIPPEYPRWGRFQELAELNNERLKTILEELIEKGNLVPGSNEQKVADYYRCGMDEDRIEQLGMQPLEAEFAAIQAATTLADVGRLIARFHKGGMTSFFSVGSTQDYGDTTRVVGELFQGGIGLPDRDYYLKDDDKSKEIREAYRTHVATMFEYMGDSKDQASANANTILAVETRLAEASKTKVALRDPADNYHIMTMAEVAQLAPVLDWPAYFKAIGVPADAPINVGQPEFLQSLNTVLTDTPIAHLITYFRWHLIDDTAPYLSSKFVNQDFHFNGTVMTGAEKLRERWKRVVGQVDSALGEALGPVYVEKYFPPDAKQRVRDMVANLKTALRDDIKQLPWMGAETRVQAIAKMDAFTDKIGYPDEWIDYSSLHIDTESFVGNVLRSHEFSFQRDIHKIGKPVDRKEWFMSPATVNAYYNPLMNEIVFPAAILQPPFFSATADDAANYGAIGAVIGHEMTHGFDDQGCQFDPQGNLRNWWTDEDLDQFKTRAAAIVKQFAGYEVSDGLFINGELVQGEAIADLGGLTLAYAAFKASQVGKPELPVIGGFTAEQRFFLGFGQIWATNQRPEYTHFQVQNDPHPNPHYRVVGTLANMPAFAAAFNCPPDSAMVLPEAERTEIW